MLKNYYRVLGVIQDAEDIVIKAAYRALAQRYHPDKWVGSQEEATTRMSEINKAFAVLSDQVKRKQYDRDLMPNEYYEPGGDFVSVEENELGTSLDQNWSVAVKYFPDLEEIVNELLKISRPLAQTYKVYLLEKKEFSKRRVIADRLERKYLEKYFGTNEEIINFSRFLMGWGVQSAVKELNMAISQLGNDIQSKSVINKILENYPHLVKPFYSSKK